MADIINDKIRKARKEHRCNYCCLPIEIKEEYNSQTIVNDGEIYTWKSHLSCNAIALKLDMFKMCGYEGVTEDDFIDIIRSEYSSLNERYVETFTYDLKIFKKQLNFVKNYYLKEKS